MMDTKYKICPQCKAEHKVSTPKCGCGYQWQTKGQAPDDPYHRLCAYHANGQRCHYVGTFSSNTLGGGPFYCRGHDGEVSPEVGAQIVEQSHRDHPNPGWWHVDLVRQQAMAEAEQQAHDYLLAHGLERQNGMFKQEHIDMLREYCKSMGLRIKRMPL